MSVVDFHRLNARIRSSLASHRPPTPTLNLTRRSAWKTAPSFRGYLAADMPMKSRIIFHFYFKTSS